MARNRCGSGSESGWSTGAFQRPSYVYLKLKQLGPSGDAAHDSRLMNAPSGDALANLAAYDASLDPAPPAEAGSPRIRRRPARARQRRAPPVTQRLLPAKA